MSANRLFRATPARLISMLAVSLLALAALCQVARAQTAADEVRARLRQWVELHNAHDANGVAQLYDQNARLFSTLGTDKPLDGREAIRAYFAQSFAMRPLIVTLGENDAVQMFPDVAVETGFYHFDPAGEHDAEERILARYTFVFARKDGAWTIVHQHSSRVPQPMAAPAKAS